ncbi:MAG: sulfite exporter TauE/SafE family protein, partial [Caulobacter sp.]|nr:sulfite exporter TauE/SafE family protein [Caulobacter sp.]
APGRPLAVAWQANLGRISGYVIAGTLAGGLGGGLLRVLRIEALAVGVRMAAGLALILVALRLLDRGGRRGRRGWGPGYAEHRRGRTCAGHGNDRGLDRRGGRSAVPGQGRRTRLRP